ERAADDGRVQRPEVGVPDAEPRGDVAPQVRVHDVGDAHQVLEDLAAGGAAEVEREAPLVAVEGLGEEAVLAGLARRHVPRYVAPGGGVLDLDDLRAQVRELERAERAGAVLLEGEDADVLQRPNG